MVVLFIGEFCPPSLVDQGAGNDVRREQDVGLRDEICVSSCRRRRLDGPRTEGTLKERTDSSGLVCHDTESTSSSAPGCLVQTSVQVTVRSEPRVKTRGLSRVRSGRGSPGDLSDSRSGARQGEAPS